MRALLIPAVLMLAACQQEPDFDERFAETEADLRARAEALELELEEPAQAPGDNEAGREETKKPTGLFSHRP